MAGVGLRLAVIGAVLIWAGAAFGAPTGSPVPGTFSGSYKVTIKITNTKSTPTHWFWAPHPTCSSPCHKLSFRERLTSEKSWRKGVITFHWNGRTYTVSVVHRKYADCRAKSGATVKAGYDVKGSENLNIRTTTNGRVVKWFGTGRDDYIPNAAGRAKHCKAGAYIYALKGVAQ